MGHNNYYVGFINKSMFLFYVRNTHMGNDIFCKYLWQGSAVICSVVSQSNDNTFMVKDGNINLCYCKYK